MLKDPNVETYVYKRLKPLLNKINKQTAEIKALKADVKELKAEVIRLAQLRNHYSSGEFE